MENKTFTCIVCPKSCSVNLTIEEEKILSVKGFGCKQGKEYGVNEFNNPKRMLSTTVHVENGVLPCLPVISNQEIPKSKLQECLLLLYKLKVMAPIKEEQVIIKDILGTGADIIASRDMNVKGA